MIKKKEEIQQKHKVERDIQPPIIISIEPSVIPTEGGDIVVRGNYFHPTAKVFVNGLEVQAVQINSETLYAQIHSYPISGNVPLFIRNPDADSENISLFYSNDDENILDFNQSIEENTIQQTEPQTLKSSPGYSGIEKKKHAPVTQKKNKTETTRPLREWGSAMTNYFHTNNDEIRDDYYEIITLDKDIYSHSDPVISTITPILSPPSGIPITITGYHFAKKVCVGIGPILLEENTFYSKNEDGKIECAIHCQTPAFPEGVYSVSVRNPKGTKATMQNVLLYIPHQKWLTVTAEPQNQRTTNMPSSTRREWGVR